MFDSDKDTIADQNDNCVFLANPSQTDTDIDGFGNRCDADFNNDLMVNVLDFGLFRGALTSQNPGMDLNADSTVNVLDFGLFRTKLNQPPGPSAQENATHTYYLLSPTANATANIQLGTTTVNIPLTAGVVTEYIAGNDPAIAGIVTADNPILVAHVAGDAMAYAVPPAAYDVTGIRTNHVIVGAMADNTNMTVYASDGTSQAYLLNSGQTLNPTIGTNGAQGLGNAIHIVADKPIGAIQYADGDTTEATAFWENTYFGTRYALPVATQYVAISCLTATTSITLTDGLNPPETKACTSDGLIPGKILFNTPVATNYNPGTSIESNNPIYVIYESAFANEKP